MQLSTSIHPQTRKPYRFIVPLGEEIPLYDPEAIEIIPVEAEKAQPLNRSSFQDQSAYRRKATTSSPASTLQFSWMYGPPPVQEGMRHSLLVRWLGMLFSFKVSEEEVLEIALIWAGKCDPPLPKEEVIHTVNSCYTLWKNKPK